MVAGGETHPSTICVACIVYIPALFHDTVSVGDCVVLPSNVHSVTPGAVTVATNVDVTESPSQICMNSSFGVIANTSGCGYTVIVVNDVNGQLLCVYVTCYT